MIGKLTGSGADADAVQKMSESQTKAGNQRKFENLKKCHFSSGFKELVIQHSTLYNIGKGYIFFQNVAVLKCTS